MSRKMIGYMSLAVALICSGLFLISLALPAVNYSTDPENGKIDSYWGGALLLLGWLEAMQLSVGGVAWLANPCFALGIIAMIIRWYGLATIIHGTAIVLASASFQLKTVCIDEGGTMAAVVGLGPGFWLWYFVMFLSCLASFLLMLMSFGSGQKLEAMTLKEGDFVQG